MLKTCICGSGNFVDQEDDDPTTRVSSSSSSPSRKKTNKTNIFNTKNNENNNNNPFSNRGRDKFETLLAELEQRREKIYQKYMDSEDHIEMIRFAYSNIKGTWVPIVVKIRDEKQKDKAAGDHRDKQNSDSSEAENMNKSSSPITEVSEKPKPDSDGMNMKKIRVVGVKNLVSWLKRYVHNHWVIMVIILIMVCLVIYGRSFAIICTCIFWYLMPLLKGNKEDNLSLMKRSLKKKKILKKDFARSKSEHKMNTTSNGFSSPKTKMNEGSAGLISSPRCSLG